jgi:predicted nucleotidyltransferase
MLLPVKIKVNIIILMTKEEIKSRLRRAVETVPHHQYIKSLALFGSYLTGKAGQASDIDLLIDFEPEASIGFFELSDIQFNFEDLLGKNVDLLTKESISKYFRNEVLAEAEVIYEK